jgi:hypothetical protein
VCCEWQGFECADAPATSTAATKPASASPPPVISPSLILIALSVRVARLKTFANRGGLALASAVHRRAIAAAHEVALAASALAELRHDRRRVASAWAAEANRDIICPLYGPWQAFGEPCRSPGAGCCVRGALVSPSR